MNSFIEWLSRLWASTSWTHLFILIGLFIVSLIFNFLIIGLVMVKIPAHYFSSHYEDDFLPNSHWTVRWGAVIAKNIAGVILVIVGIILSFPGVPGQGFLTILVGLIILDIPGKRPLEARLIKRPAILAAINNLRSRYNKPPLILD